jgi:isopenicillin N synthase-like dioxygenase
MAGGKIPTNTQLLQQIHAAYVARSLWFIQYGMPKQSEAAAVTRVLNRILAVMKEWGFKYLIGYEWQAPAAPNSSAVGTCC